jgi:hypothetical protein
VSEEKRHWIHSAISKGGSLSRSVDRAGESAAEHAKDGKSDSAVIGRRERLTQTLMALAKKKG